GEETMTALPTGLDAPVRGKSYGSALAARPSDTTYRDAGLAAVGFDISNVEAGVPAAAADGLREDANGVFPVGVDIAVVEHLYIAPRAPVSGGTTEGEGKSHVFIGFLIGQASLAVFKGVVLAA